MAENAVSGSAVLTHRVSTGSTVQQDIVFRGWNRLTKLL